MHKVVWNFDTNSITADGHCIALSHKEYSAPRCKRCRVSTDLEILPLSEAVIPAVTIFGHFHAKSTNEQWTTIPSEPIPGLRVSRTLISNRSPTVAVRLRNVTRRPVGLHKGQSVSANVLTMPKDEGQFVLD